jgi:serine phosphatase RsbU (regulator of sigma subunit)
MTSTPLTSATTDRRRARPRGVLAAAAARAALLRRRATTGRGVSYRLSLILSLSLLVVATGLAVSAFAFRGAAAGTTELAHALFQEVSDHAVTKTRAFLMRAAPIAEGLGNLADLGLATTEPDRLSRQLTAILRANEGVSWLSYSNEAGSFVGAYRPSPGVLRVNRSSIDARGRVHVVEHEVLPDGSWKLWRVDDDSGYDPRRRPFYQRAKSVGRVVWVPPYVFYDQGVPGVTCANPVFDGDGKLRGVFTVDFDLNTLSLFVRQLSVSPHSHLFIMSSDGILLAHPTHKVQVFPGGRGRGELKRVADLDDPLIRAFDAQLRPQDRTAAADEAGRPVGRARQFEFTHDGVDYFARVTAFPVDQDLVWVVGAMAPRSDFLGAARRSMRLALAASLGALGVALLLAAFLAGRVSGPILSLVSFMRRVGDGELSARPRLGGAREFRQLSAALEHMIDDLRDRTRLRSAMAVATEVQQALLPSEPPRVEGLDVAGFSHYCDETGGDYYDYVVPHTTRPGSVLFAVGDVMGHGIGSALVMASARAVLRSSATTCGHLGQLMTHLNALLVHDLRGQRFVSMILWLVDVRGGTACWANAGHHPAIVYDPATQAFEQSGRDGIPLGIDADAEYHEHVHGPLRRGQVMVLGTDGIWETTNDRGEFFGVDRLRDSIHAAAGRTASEIAAAVRRDLDAFRGKKDYKDDVTLVVIKVTAESRTHTDDFDVRSPGGA